MGPCAKQRVTCHVYLHDDGRTFVGENLCVNPQQACPRTPGEGYRKCFSVCGTIGHAEEVALRQMRLAGFGPSDVRAVEIRGHYGPCASCHALLDSLNLMDRTVFINQQPDAPQTDENLEVIAVSYALDAAQQHTRLDPND